MQIDIIEAIIPTIVVPFAFLGFVLSAIAAAIASLFGVTLKTEGPRRLLEVLLKPKVIIISLLVNAGLWGGYRAYVHWKNAPSPLFWIQWQNNQNRKMDLTERGYANLTNPTFSGIKNPENLFAGQDIIDIRLRRLVDIESGSFNQAVVSGKSVFVGSKSGYVFEFDTDSGEKLRQFYVGTHVTPASLLWNGFLFAGEGVHETHHARIYKFSLDSGKLVGSFTTTGHVEGTPLLVETESQPVVLVAGGKGGVYGVDPLSMKALWNLKDYHVDSGFVESDGVAFFTSGIEKGESSEQFRYVFAIDVLTGEIVWQKETPVSGWMPPIVLGEQVCVGYGEIYWPSSYGQLSCYDKNNGKSLWSVNHESPIASHLAFNNDFIVFADLDGNVCSVSRAEKKINWCREAGKTSRPSYSSPVFIDSRNVAFSSKDHGLFIFDTDGEQKAHWQHKEWKTVFAKIHMTDKGWFLPTYGGQLFHLSPVYESRSLSSKGSHSF